MDVNLFILRMHTNFCSVHVGSGSQRTYVTYFPCLLNVYKYFVLGNSVVKSYYDNELTRYFRAKATTIILSGITKRPYVVVFNVIIINSFVSFLFSSPASILDVWTMYSVLNETFTTHALYAINNDKNPRKHTVLKHRLYRRKTRTTRTVNTLGRVFIHVHEAIFAMWQ